jgi:hypothetical protein
MRHLPKYVHGFIDRHGKARWYGGNPDIEPTSPNDRVWTPSQTLISVLLMLSPRPAGAP